MAEGSAPPGARGRPIAARVEEPRVEGGAAVHESPSRVSSQAPRFSTRDGIDASEPASGGRDSTSSSQ